MDLSAPHSNKPAKDQQLHHHQVASSSELLSSAKLVAEATKSAIHGQTDKVDKGKVAGAADNLLGAAAHYGKLEEKGYGKYVDKAQDYLHQYHSSPLNSGHPTDSAHSAEGDKTASSHSSGDHSSGSDTGGGYGGYLKMAEGFLKKH